MVFRLSICLFFILFSSTAMAQEAPCDHPACRATLPFGAACRIYLNDGDATLHRSVLGGMVGGVSRAVPEGCYQPGRVYGLQGWRFNTRGGHKIRQVKFLQNPESMEFAFVDKSGNDFADGFVWLVPLPEGTQLRSQTADCTGGCRIDLDAKDPFDTVVLLGFYIERDDNDGHVRRFSVGPVAGSPTAPQIRVNFQDDDFSYSAEIQYAYLPPDAIVGRGRVVTDYAGTEGGFGTATVRTASLPDPDLFAVTGQGDIVLQAFMFEFRNGGHFLEDIGLERRSTEYEAWFQDNQARGERRHPDDPFTWRADFVFLQ